MTNLDAIEAELGNWNKRLRIYPFDARNYIHRGMTYFKLGKIKESLKDYNKAEELNPQLTPYLWQRGLSYYYLGKYAQAARQFEIDLSVNSLDVEETIWYYLCIARLENDQEAKKSLLPVKYDPRPIMRQIYQLFAGNCSVETLIELANKGDIRDLLYSNLYAGLYYEAQKDEQKSTLYLNEAVTYEINDYMWYLARIHQQLRLLEAAKINLTLRNQHPKV